MRVKGIAFSGPGCSTLKRISETLGDGMEAVCRTKADSSGIPQTEDVDAWVREGFEGCDALVFVGATGIAVRYIAPYVRSKDRDPAVVCVDERGRFCIPLLSGHLGGANRLAGMIAEGIGAVPVITTATDINGVFAVDTFAKDNDLRIGSLEAAKEVSAALLRGDAVCFRSDIPFEGDLPGGLIMGDHSKAGINTMFNTATVTGIGCNIYGPGFPRTYIPSFSEGGAQGFKEVPLARFFDIAERMMARRHKTLTDADRRLYTYLFEHREGN